MTPLERAEKIADELSSCTHNCYVCDTHTVGIAAQIEEATDDAWKIGRHKGFAEGFRAAREKARGIAENVCPDENFGEDCHESIAQRIGGMEP